MSKKWQAANWIILWGFWVMVSRNNHPTLLLNVIATGLLLAAFASAIYFNWLVLVPRYWKRRQFPAYWVNLFLATSVLTAVDVVVIQKAYDLWWGPDAKRFGFWVNLKGCHSPKLASLPVLSESALRRNPNLVF